MLRRCAIRDMVLIEAAELRFRPGLNVLTGETGAGKSILLDCLGFVLGWRGRADLVRAGRRAGRGDRGVRPRPGPPRAARCSPRRGLPRGRRADPAPHRRAPTGASRPGSTTGASPPRRCARCPTRWSSCTASRTTAACSTRAAIARCSTPSPGRGRRSPRFAPPGPPARPPRAAWPRPRRRSRPRRATPTISRHAAAELDRLAPEAGEEPRLDARRRALQAAERIRADVARAAEALGPDGAEGRMLDAAALARGRRRRARRARSTRRSTRSARALAELGEARRAVEACARPAATSIPASSSGSRSGCSRSGRWRASTRSCPRLCRRWPPSCAPGSAALDAGAADLARLRGRARRGRGRLRRAAAAALSRAPARGGGAARRARWRRNCRR